MCCPWGMNSKLYFFLLIHSFTHSFNQDACNTSKAYTVLSISDECDTTAIRDELIV